MGATARVWDFATGKLLHEFGPFPPFFNEVTPVVSPDGRWLAVPTTNLIQVWEVATGRHLYDVTDLWLPTGFAFSPDGRFFATPGDGGKITIRDAATGRVLRTCDGDVIFGDRLIFCGPALLASADENFVVPPVECGHRGDAKSIQVTTLQNSRPGSRRVGRRTIPGDGRQRRKEGPPMGRGDGEGACHLEH